jgi:uncharacterized protein
MNTKISDQEMPEDEAEALSSFLARVKGGEIPNVEAFDGFLTALVISPDLVKPSEFTDVIIKGSSEEGDLVFVSTDEAQRFFGIVMNHWNRINSAFRSGDIYMPLLEKDMNGEYRGNDWAKGFLRGTRLRHDEWAEIAGSDEHGAPFIYLWSLAYEDHPDASMRPRKTSFTPEEREELVTRMIAGSKRLYDYFHGRRRQSVASPRAPWAASAATEPFAQPVGKVGRNDPCPCGSGKKFKKCCGAATLH